MQSSMPTHVPMMPSPETTAALPDQLVNSTATESQQKFSSIQLLFGFLVVGILVAVVFAAYYLGMQGSKPIPLLLLSPTPELTAVPIPSPTTLPTPPTTPTPMTVMVSEPLLYRNTEYGFNLELPETWSTYTVSSRPGSDPIEVVLTVPSPNAAALPVGTLNIYLFTKSEWASHSKKPQYITENNEYIFATDHYSNSRDDCVQLDEFQCDRRLEVPSVIKTFSLE